MGIARYLSQKMKQCGEGKICFCVKNNFYLFSICCVIMSPKSLGRHCVCSISYYYYSFFLSFFCQKFVQHISRRLLNGNQWNFTGMLSTMSRCADYFRNFQNGRRCHGNGQNPEKIQNGGRCHGSEGAKNVKFKLYSGSFGILTQK